MQEGSYKELSHIIGFDGNNFRYMQVGPHALRELTVNTRVRSRRDFKKEFRGVVPQVEYGPKVDLEDSFLTPVADFNWHVWSFGERVDRAGYEPALLALQPNPNVLGAKVRITDVAHDGRYAQYAQQLDEAARKTGSIYLIARGPCEMYFGSVCALPVRVAQGSERVPRLSSGIIIDESHSYVPKETDVTGSTYQINGAVRGMPYVHMSVPTAEIYQFPVTPEMLRRRAAV